MEAPAENIQEPRTQSDRALLRFFWGYLKRFPLLLIASVAVILASALVNLILPYILRIAIDQYIIPGDFAGVYPLIGIALAAAGAWFVLVFFRALVTNVLGQRLMWRMRSELMEHLLSLSVRFYNENPVGKIITRLTNDIQNLAEMLTAGLSSLVADIVLIIGILVVMLTMDWRLTLISLAVALPVGLLLQIVGVRMRTIFRAVRKIVAEMNIYLNENLAGFQEVKAFNRQDYNRQEFSAINGRYLSENLKAMRLRTLFYPSVNFLKQLSRAMVLIFGGLMVAQGQATVGILVAFFTYVEMFFEPIADFSEKFAIFQTAFASLEKILDFFQNDDREYRGGTALLEPLRGQVEFESVSFAYEGTPVLQEVSFSVQPGQSLAIVGPTGAGKTTLFSLLLGFWSDYQGKIRVDGVELRDLSLASLRGQSALVLQDVTLFHDTIARNVSLWEEEPAGVAEALDYVNAQFVGELPEKEKTLLAPNGANLSAGQRQLLSFARAIYRKPSLLLLDEATANIDSDTEKLVQEAVAKLMHGRTSIVIAHRLSTIIGADQIIALQDGRVVECGSHTELMERKGFYYELYTTQLSTLEAIAAEK
ncbi:MAG: ABC transporter ATP-binding protein [Coprothermobacterota bacterium]|nr:ABC transporter ATP-binding protein [Coprothermobacterota bacterium]